MDIAFVLKIIWAFALVALLLYGMMLVTRAMQRGRLTAGTGKRLITTVESTMLGQHVYVHVIRVADKYFLVGGGNAGVAMLSELPPEEIEPYIAQQRAALLAQRDTLIKPFARFIKR